MMEHNTAQEQISQFLDNELSTTMLQPLFYHLGECGVCRNFFLQTKKIHDDVKMLEHPAIPEEIDRKFELLEMKGLTHLPTTHQRTVSISTAVLSGIMAIMIGILSLILLNKNGQDERLSIHQRQFESVYQQYTFDHQTLRLH